ncbi:hypothetical protein CEXT_247731 [Caerostris extrusa]|uniref:Uncharacterized protein n=1 Tax=Caerostris extrusa TaxID=172846 RepID=A0AAV4MP09_CAEEX|nr:hypothetical protein CEXT_247731 [Caerostris extrusa]
MCEGVNFSLWMIEKDGMIVLTHFLLSSPPLDCVTHSFTGDPFQDNSFGAWKSTSTSAAKKIYNPPSVLTAAAVKRDSEIDPPITNRASPPPQRRQIT